MKIHKIIFSILVLVLAWLISGCPQSKKSVSAMTQNEEHWSGPVNNLQTRLQLPPGPFRMGQCVDAILWFRNTGAEDLLLYMIPEQSDRFGTSTIYIHDSLGHLTSMQPDIKISAKVIDVPDLHPIEPGRELSFTQTFCIRESEFKSAGQYTAQWDYFNDIDHWPHGILTFEGPPKKKYLGRDIPRIWTGKIESRASFTVN